MTIWAVLPAAGVGRRMGSNIPKQYHTIHGVPLILHSLRRLNAVTAIQKIIVVLHPEDLFWPKIQTQIEGELEDRIEIVMGGDERYRSVLNGLNSLLAVAQNDDWVMVHDAVRPCVRSADIENLIASVAQHPIGGLLGSAVDNTLKRVDENSVVMETVDRGSYWNALTPQMFRYSSLREAIESVVTTGACVTDEALAIELAGYKPVMVAGNKDNIKITHEADLLLAGHILQSQADEDESK